MKVSVVMPTFRRPDLLARCLEALAAQTLDHASFEVLVCDDADQPEIGSLVNGFAARTGIAFRYLPVRGRHGPAAARNLGWRAAKAPVIAFTDDDTVPDPKWLELGLASLPNTVAAGQGRIVVPVPAVPTDYELNTSHLGHAEFATANAFVRRPALEAVGGFDERFAAAWREDSDLQFSLLEHGYDVVQLLSAVVIHPVRPAGWGVSLRQQRGNFWEALLYKKHPRLYRARIRNNPPFFYITAVSTLALSLGLAMAGEGAIAATFAGAYLLMAVLFSIERLQNTARDARHVTEMLVTSALIPPVALYWRLRGAIRHRVLFA